MRTLRPLNLVCAVFVLFGSSAIAQSDAIVKADALLAEFITTSPAIAVAVVKDGNAVYSRALGIADLDKKTPATTETNFRLASVSKQFTAMATMILIEQKRLSLASTLRDIFPAFPAYGERVTVRHLLNHTSGLHDYEDLMPTTTSMPLLDRDVLYLLAQQDEPTSPPGVVYSYSNSGYAMLANIVEEVSGHSFASFMKQNIFTPLRMSNTMVNERNVTAIPNRAYGYSKTRDGFKNTDQSLTSYVCGDGGVYSNINDMVRWDQALYGNDLITSGMQRMGFTPDPVTIDDKGKGYGFGWMIDEYRGKRRLSHSGSTCGFSNKIERFPDEHFTVIVLTNRAGNDMKITERLVNLFLFSEP